MPGSSYRKLFAIAEDQMGYVTTAQAAGIGIPADTLVKMAARGVLERTSHGVYRFVDFPWAPLAQYMEAVLWPVGTRGLLSHQTALSLHQISDVSPAKVHLTLPVGYRVQRKVPAYLVVHHADVPDTERTVFEGLPISTPVRTIRDCAEAHLGPALLRQAIADALRAGLLSAAEAGALERTYLAA